MFDEDEGMSMHSDVISEMPTILSKANAPAMPDCAASTFLTTLGTKVDLTDPTRMTRQEIYDLVKSKPSNETARPGKEGSYLDHDPYVTKEGKATVEAAEEVILMLDKFDQAKDKRWDDYSLWIKAYLAENE